MKSNRKTSPLDKLHPGGSGPMRGKTMARKTGMANEGETKGKESNSKHKESKNLKAKHPLSQINAPKRSKNRTPRY